MKKIKIISNTLLIQTIFLFCIILNVSAEGIKCESLLPLQIRQQLSIAYQEWKVLDYPDLLVDDQIGWEQNHKGNCPGVAIGYFSGKIELSYAILLIKSVNNKKFVKLVVAEKKKGQYDFKDLDGSANEVTNFPVIYTGKPGTYESVYYKSKNEEKLPKKIQTKNDVIIFSQLESWTSVFYFESGKYNKILISY